MPPRSPLAQTGQRPYLILTLRRTGGTSLMGFLSRVSAFPSIQHEPFNKDRIWGGLREEYKDRYHTPPFATALAGRLDERPNIKHCFELVAPELTTALIDACVARNYRLFLLLRRRETARLRSLAIAQVTGAWGPRQAARIYPDILSGAMSLDPVDLAGLRRSARRDAIALAAVRAMLARTGHACQDLYFEDVYARDGGLPDRARVLAAQLGVTVAPDDPRLAAMAEPPGISTSEILPFVPNAAALEAMLRRIEARERAAPPRNGAPPPSLSPS